MKLWNKHYLLTHDGGVVFHRRPSQWIVGLPTSVYPGLQTKTSTVPLYIAVTRPLDTERNLLQPLAL